MQNIWDYGEVWKPRKFDNGDRTSYGHSSTKVIEIVEIDGQLIEVIYFMGKPSKHKGAKLTIS